MRVEVVTTDLGTVAIVGSRADVVRIPRGGTVEITHCADGSVVVVARDASGADVRRQIPAGARR